MTSASALALFLAVSLSGPATPSVGRQAARPLQGGALQAVTRRPFPEEGLPRQEFREDPERLRRTWEACLPPRAHRRAIESTGMLAAVQAWAAKQPDAPGTSKATTSWTLIGPIGGQPGSHSSSQNGRIAGVQKVGTDLYAGACIGGLWKSSLLSSPSWTSVGDTLPNPSVRAFWVDPADPDRIFVGTGDLFRYKGAGLYQSVDGGGTWSLEPLPIDPGTNLPYEPDAFFRILPRAGSSWILAASTHGLFLSKDAGVSWTRPLGGDVTDLVAHPTDGQVFLAAVWGTGLFRSSDGGDSWVPISDPKLPDPASWGRGALARCKNSPANLALVVADKVGDLRGVYRSPDGGTSWDDVTSNLGATGAFASQQALHALAIAIKPNDPNRIYVGSVYLAVTTTAGASWGLVGFDIGHPDFTQVHFPPEWTEDMILCNDGGIYLYKFLNGTTTSLIGNGTTGLAVMEVDFMDADRDMRLIGTQDNGSYSSIDYGSTWSTLGGGDGGDVQITDPVARRIWWGAGVYSPPPAWRIHRVQYGQIVYFMQNPDEPQDPMFYDPFGKRVWVNSGQGLFSISETAFTTFNWTLEHAGGWGQQSPHNTRRIWGSRATGNVLFLNYAASISAPDDNERDVTILRKNPGGTWSEFHRENVAPSGKSVLFIAPSTEWPGECWIGIAGSKNDPNGGAMLMHTTDYGATWTDLTGVLGSTRRVSAVVNTPFEPNLLYAGTDIGVFRSTDAGLSWQPFGQGMPIAAVTQLEFVPDDTHAAGVHQLVVSTKGRGVWKRDVAMPAIVYVDKASTSPTQDGTFESPYKTVAAAVAAAPANAIVALRQDTYTEPQVATKGVRVVTWAGTSVIR